jgi:CBS domain-containing protein
MNQGSRQLSEVADHNIVFIPDASSVGDAAAVAEAAGASKIVVVTDSADRPVGLLNRRQLASADEQQQVADLISRPVVLLPAHLTVAEALRSWPLAEFDALEFAGVVVTDGDRTVGVWGSDQFAAFIATRVRSGAIPSDTGLGGGIISIGLLVRDCGFADATFGKLCAARRTFAAKPNPLPACDNPKTLTPHTFGW